MARVMDGDQIKQRTPRGFDRSTNQCLEVQPHHYNVFVLCSKELLNVAGYLVQGEREETQNLAAFCPDEKSVFHEMFQLKGEQQNVCEARVAE